MVGPSHTSRPTFADPYVDWWTLAEGSRTQKPKNEQIEFQFLQPRIFRLKGRKKNQFDLPMPSGAINKNFDPDAWDDWKAQTSNYPHVGPDDVILGVIDTNFALGQRRFRFNDGQTRFLAAWLQGADSPPDPRKEATHLPFGREFSTVEIEQKLAEYSGGNLSNPLNQESFNRNMGLVDANKPSWQGAKELQLSVSHGTHILDVAGGINPGNPGADLASGRRCHLIAVSLPPLFFHGHSGNFLQYHAVLGLIRIMRIADAISKAKHEASCHGFDKDHQFPVVVNFSFGFEAGPKDGSLPMERSIRNVIRKRARDSDDDGKDGRKQGRGPLDVKTFVTLPAGNSNLLRVSGRDLISPDESDAFEVVLQPNDHSSTYVEFWSEPVNRSTGYFDDFEFRIDLPNGRKINLQIKKPRRGTPRRAKILAPDGTSQIGRVYYGLSQSALRSADQVRLRVVVAIAPTLVFFPMNNEARKTTVKLAPAGRWKFRLKKLKHPLRIDAYIQADLFGGPLPQNARRAYFDHELYRNFMEGGQVRDSFSCSDPTKPLDSGPISRVGTHNALASTPYVSMIGGYRYSNGCPATYSATGYRGPPTHNSQSDVDVIFPCEDGFTHAGILGAGPRDGAALALNGTSVATALSARTMIDTLLANPNLEVGQPWLQSKAYQYAKVGRPDHYYDAAPLKAGAGHLPYPVSYRDNYAGVGMRVRRSKF